VAPGARLARPRLTYCAAVGAGDARWVSYRSRAAAVGLGLAVAAGVAGVGLALAGVESTARLALVLLFLAVVPTAALGGLMRSFDPFARIVLAFTANLALLCLTALVLLAEGVWSPLAGLVVMGVIAALCGLGQVPLLRRAVVARATPWLRPTARR
jgi:hypothetical protein